MECGKKLSSALPGCVAVMVYSVVSGRATGNHRIRDCVKSPLKKTADEVGVGGGVFDLDAGD